MSTKRTILSEKESNLIESLISKYGSIVSFEQIYDQLKDEINRQTAYNLVNKFVKNGWLVTITSGVYFIAGLDTRGFVALPIYKIAQVLEKDSYVSFEAALQHHGMFDQLVNTVTSLSLNKRKTAVVEGINYKFILIKNNQFYGWNEQRVENYLVKIATAEKALLDFLAFERSVYAVDLVLEKLTEHHQDLNLDLFIELAQKQTLTVKRILGFLFDKADIGSHGLHELVKDKRSPSFMTAASNKFNAKWRLYYEDRFAD